MKLMQRLRRVRQLGLAYLVYPSAQHSRFVHSLGAVHVADRMARMVEPTTEERFLRATRIAALLHDSGHTAFSHVGERALMREPRFRQGISVAKDLLNKFFDDPA